MCLFCNVLLDSISEFWIIHEIKTETILQVASTQTKTSTTYKYFKRMTIKHYIDNSLPYVRMNLSRQKIKQLSRAMRKCVLCHMRTTKAQISVRTHATWSAPLLFAA